MSPPPTARVGYPGAREHLNTTIMVVDTMSEAISLPAPAADLPITPPAADARQPEAPVAPIFLARRSTRAYAERPVAEETLRTVLEAARWAPSSNNLQPWLFVHAATPARRAAFLEGLHPFNRRWAERAPVLVYLFARTSDDDGHPNAYAEFDAGAAWMSLSLQATALGLSAHAMGGILKDRMPAIAGVDPAEYRPLAAIALGYPLPEAEVPEALRASERPTPRRPLDAVARAGPDPLGRPGLVA